MKNVLIKNSGDLIQSIQNKDITTFKLEFSKQNLTEKEAQQLNQLLEKMRQKETD